MRGERPCRKAILFAAPMAQPISKNKVLLVWMKKEIALPSTVGTRTSSRKLTHWQRRRMLWSCHRPLTPTLYLRTDRTRLTRPIALTIQGPAFEHFTGLRIGQHRNRPSCVHSSGYQEGDVSHLAHLRCNLRPRWLSTRLYCVECPSIGH
jgi:hypothetical protein